MLHAGDLAPGDRGAARLDFAALQVDEIRSPEDPRFAVAYDTLQTAFRRGGSLESREVLAQRMGWEGAMRYALFLVRDAAGTVAAVRDHTAILSPGGRACTVHLSHLLVLPAWRRTGLAGWMRALPLATARAFAVEDVTLVAEMDSAIAMAAYGRAGFLQVDPGAVRYLQPDFRPAEIIDATGGPRPAPFTLVIRQVGRENEATISPARLRQLAADLYRMYARTFRPSDMPSLEAYPTEGCASVALQTPRAS